MWHLSVNTQVEREYREECTWRQEHLYFLRESIASLKERERVRQSTLYFPTKNNSCTEERKKKQKHEQECLRKALLFSHFPKSLINELTKIPPGCLSKRGSRSWLRQRGYNWKRTSLLCQQEGRPEKQKHADEWRPSICTYLHEKKGRKGANSLANWPPTWWDFNCISWEAGWEGEQWD